MQKGRQAILPGHETVTEQSPSDYRCPKHFWGSQAFANDDTIDTSVTQSDTSVTTSRRGTQAPEPHWALCHSSNHYEPNLVTTALWLVLSNMS